jgi:hypothetical protein
VLGNDGGSQEMGFVKERIDYRMDNNESCFWLVFDEDEWARTCDLWMCISDRQKVIMSEGAIKRFGTRRGKLFTFLCAA